VRQIKFTPGEELATDSLGGRWEVQGPSGGEKPFFLLSQIPDWDVRMEGVRIGSGVGKNPAEVAREVLAASAVTSLPEAVAVFVDSEKESFVVFTLGGEAFCVPRIQFSAEVERSSRWTQARQAKRPEIDALVEELKRIPRK
jgi:hypothetical protein